MIREELAYVGLSVIIARRICITYAREIKDNQEVKNAKREL